MIRIRKLQKKDVPACYRMHVDTHFHKETSTWDLDFWYAIQKLLTDSWVAVDEMDKPIGYMIGRIHHADVFDGELAYNWMDTCVLEKEKGSGLANEFISFLNERYPLQWGVVNPDNKRMLGYLFKNGWKHLLDDNYKPRVFKNYYSDGADAFIVFTEDSERWQSG